MLIVGAKGHAMEVFQCLNESHYDNLQFYDDVDNELTSVFNKYRVCKSYNEVEAQFYLDRRYILGVGGATVRRQLANKFDSLGGILTSIVADTAVVSSAAILDKGLNIMHFCFVAPNVVLGKGVLLNTGAAIHHDVIIGDYCEISPGARVLGRCVIEPNVTVGAGAVILPNLTIGEEAIVGAGAVVTRKVLPGSKIAGVPARQL